MGIPIELWRARIGLFSCSGSVRSSNNTHSDMKGTLSKISSFTSPGGSYLPLFLMVIGLLVLLLKAGDVELNPGPNEHKTSEGMPSCAIVLFICT